ncbi:DUF1624 domain-containing protein [Nocardioides panacisoli]|uniref:heparan-alpha-glucosaminide N-acetyltransferase domain-containing protein n=1 Tax=Nocardioides panacisoli TaxID=627624 RepID=UPI001C63108C|nr:heparan-alpha-glucosaminide N-acetyltransferase domain-containing protein [Nocardioides panacisoli]QYJ04380.1 DUF1624 domain-containing protein [Nocardioides panacisoli]
MPGDVLRPGRLVAVDVARCLALLGMMATHVVGKRTPDGDLTWAYALAGGRASALFAVLAGVSLALATGRTEPIVGTELRRARLGLAARAGLVALLGLALGGLDSGIAIILAHYGVLFLLALPFLSLRARSLAALTVGWVLLTPVLLHLLLPRFPEFDGRSPELGDLADPGRLLGELAVTGTYPVLPWLGFVLAGLAVGRTDLRRPVRALALLVGGALAAAAAYAVSRALTALPAVRDGLGYPDLDHAGLRNLLADGTGGSPPVDGGWSWLLVVAPHSATPFDLVHTIGCALLVLGGCLLLAEWLPAPGRRVLVVLFGAGTMTLSLYTLHVLMLTPSLWPPEESDAYVWHVLVVLAVGAVTVAAGRRGPLETVVGAPSRWSRERAVSADGHRGSGNGWTS